MSSSDDNPLLSKTESNNKVIIGGEILFNQIETLNTARTKDTNKINR